jgi:hypothetical protein
VRLTLRLDGDRSLHYRDIRALGTVALMTAARFAAYTAASAPSPSTRPSRPTCCASGSPARARRSRRC